MLLDPGACNLREDTTQTDGFTSLMAASYAEHGAVTRMFLETGADVDKVDPQGATPLETWPALRPGSFLGNDVRTMCRSFSKNISNPSIIGLSRTPRERC